MLPNLRPGQAVTEQQRSVCVGIAKIGVTRIAEQLWSMKCFQDNTELQRALLPHLTASAVALAACVGGAGTRFFWNRGGVIISTHDHECVFAGFSRSSNVAAKSKPTRARGIKAIATSAAGLEYRTSNCTPEERDACVRQVQALMLHGLAQAQEQVRARAVQRG